MSTEPFRVEFSEDMTKVQVVTDRGKKLLAALVDGPCPIERRDRIAKLIGDLVAECQGQDVFIAPFDGGKPS